MGGGEFEVCGDVGGEVGAWQTVERRSRTLRYALRATQGERKMIAPCNETHVPAMFAIVNDAAQAYRGHVPDDCLHDPYMSEPELRGEIAALMQAAVQAGVWQCRH